MRAFVLLLLLALLPTASFAQPALSAPAVCRSADDGVALAYRVVGQGERIVVLLHGWPETSHGWRRVAPLLAAEGYRVIVPDLRGFGASPKPTAGYDTRTLAEDVRRLVRCLGASRIDLVGHDIGLAVAYAYAAEHPDEVRRLVLSEMVVLGYGSEELRRRLWHWGFNTVPDMPEALIVGRERAYFGLFYTRDSRTPGAIAPADIDEYVRSFSQPGAALGSLGFYRALAESERQNTERFARRGKLAMPVLAIGAEHALAGDVLASVARVATDVRARIIAGSGHWVPEERPEEYAAAVLAVLAEDQ